MARPHSAPGSKLKLETVLSPHHRAWNHRSTCASSHGPSCCFMSHWNPQPWPCRFHSSCVFFCRVPYPCLFLWCLSPSPATLSCLHWPRGLKWERQDPCCCAHSQHSIRFMSQKPVKMTDGGKEGPRRQVQIIQLWFNQGWPSPRT